MMMSHTDQNLNEYSSLICDKRSKLSYFQKFCDYEVIANDFRKIFLLSLTYIAYLLFGAIMFQMFEAPLEKAMRSQVTRMIDVLNYKLTSFPNHTITHEDMKDMLHKILKARDMNLVDQYGNSTNHNWNFYNSFCFAVTIVTTIGGHLSPSSAAGKMFCLFYALFGIPLTGLLLGSIGSLFSRCFVQRIASIKHGMICFLPWFAVFMIIPSMVFAYIERWSFLEGFYYSFITLSTIGFGDYVPGNFGGARIVLYKLMVVLWIILGLSYISMILNLIRRGNTRVDYVQEIHSYGGSFQSKSSLKANNDSNWKKKLSLADGKHLPRRHSDVGSTPIDKLKTFDFFLNNNYCSKASPSYQKSYQSVFPYYP